MDGISGHNGTDGIPGLNGLPGADGKRGKKGKVIVRPYSVFTHYPLLLIPQAMLAISVIELLVQCNSQRVECNLGLKIPKYESHTVT